VTLVFPSCDKTPDIDINNITLSFHRSTLSFASGFAAGQWFRYRASLVRKPDIDTEDRKEHTLLCGR
jgi:hypothetical protein